MVPALSSVLAIVSSLCLHLVPALLFECSRSSKGRIMPWERYSSKPQSSLTAASVDRFDLSSSPGMVNKCEHNSWRNKSLLPQLLMAPCSAAYRNLPTMYVSWQFPLTSTRRIRDTLLSWVKHCSHEPFSGITCQVPITTLQPIHDCKWLRHSHTDDHLRNLEAQKLQSTIYPLQLPSTNQTETSSTGRLSVLLPTSVMVLWMKLL